MEFGSGKHFRCLICSHNMLSLASREKKNYLKLTQTYLNEAHVLLRSHFFLCGVFSLTSMRKSYYSIFSHENRENLDTKTRAFGIFLHVLYALVFFLALDFFGSFFFSQSHFHFSTWKYSNETDFVETFFIFFKWMKSKKKNRTEHAKKIEMYSAMRRNFLPLRIHTEKTKRQQPSQTHLWKLMKIPNALEFE